MLVDVHHCWHRYLDVGFGREEQPNATADAASTPGVLDTVPDSCAWRLCVNDLPVGVPAPDFSVAGEIEQITSAESYLVPFDGGTGQQPLGDGVVAAHPVLVVGVMTSGRPRKRCASPSRTASGPSKRVPQGSWPSGVSRTQSSLKKPRDPVEERE